MTEILKDFEIPDDILRVAHRRMRVGNELVIDFYLRIISEGASPKIAESLALQQSPGIGVTDAIFIQDQNRWGRSILDRMGGDERAVQSLRKSLARNGYKLQNGDHYIPTAARFAGDPEAIVNGKQTFGDLKKVVKERGTAAYGAVDVKHDSERARSAPKSRLNSRILNRIDSHQVAANPELKKTPVADRRAAIIEKHGGK